MDHAVLENDSYREMQLYLNCPEYWDGTDWHSLGGGVPMLVNNSAVIPVMEVIGGMGGTAVLDTKRDPGWTAVICHLGKDTINMWVGRQTYFINGEEHTFQIAPKLVNGCVMVPARELMLAMNCTVGWDNYADGWTGRITIGYMA